MLSTLNFGSSEPISQKDLKEKDGNSINASIFNDLQDLEVLQNINRLDGYITENRGQVSNNSVRYYIQGKDVGFLDDGVLFEITESVQVKSPESGSRESTAIIDRPYPEGNINDIRMKYEDSENEYPYRGFVWRKYSSSD